MLAKSSSTCSSASPEARASASASRPEIECRGVASLALVPPRSPGDLDLVGGDGHRVSLCVRPRSRRAATPGPRTGRYGRTHRTHRGYWPAGVAGPVARATRMMQSMLGVPASVGFMASALASARTLVNRYSDPLASR